MNKYFHICGSGAFLRLLFLFSRLLALPAPCPYRAEQATGFAGGYDSRCKESYKTAEKEKAAETREQYQCAFAYLLIFRQFAALLIICF